jgi:C-terminal processing protease CtpA/Prc
VFSPAEFTYSDSLWTKPVAILVDQGTASAAEEFAAVLQDNSAALIVGSRTLGAGCGYTNGGTPTLLPHTGATLKVPDCARFRADGSNEVNGVLPDVQIPWRRDDGTRFKARLLEVRLPTLIQRSLGESGSMSPSFKDEGCHKRADAAAQKN